MQTRMGLRYVGPAVEAGSMDVYEASANMIAFSEFVVVAAKSHFGAETEIKAEVRGFARGSFETNLVFQVMGAAATIFSTVSISDLWKTISSAIELWKFLKGEPAKEILHADNNEGVIVTNNNGQVIQISTQSLMVVMSEKGSQAVGQFVKRALENPGIDNVSITGKSAIPIAEISQAQGQYFVPVVPQDTVTDVTIPMTLIIEAPVFKEDNKWRFFDGQQSFYAAIEDHEFIARVNAGERFGKGDILQADVRICQQQSGMKLTAERAIVRVREHKTGPKQLSL